MEHQNCLGNKKIKHVSELTAEELLKQLEESDEKEEQDLSLIIQDPIVDFINNFNLKSGKNPVPIKGLVLLYNKTNENKISSLALLNKLRMYFKVVDGLVYLNKSAFHYHNELEILLTKRRRNRFTSESFTKHVFKFIDETGIQKGPNPVPLFVLYCIYEDFCIKNKIKPMSKKTFELVANKLWKKIKTQYGDSYLVNSNGDLYRVRQYEELKRRYNKKQKKKETRKKS